MKLHEEGTKVFSALVTPANPLLEGRTAVISTSAIARLLWI